MPGPNRHQFVRTLGSGRFAEVTCVVRLGPAGFRRLVALKRPHGDEPIAVERLLREARIGGLLRHESIVATLEVERDHLGWYLVLEYVDGPSLAAVLAAASDSEGGTIPVGAAFELAAQLCAGLHHAHTALDQEGRPLELVHGDLSPANLLLTQEGQLKIADFGGAVSALDPTGQSSSRGTPGYTAPEIARHEPLDVRTDLFSAGAILREVFARTTLRDDARIRAVLARATAPERSARHPDIAAFAAELAALRPPVPLGEPRIGNLDPAWVRGLATSAAAGDPQASSRALPPRPYRGLESFGPESASLFFGREDDAARIARRIRSSNLVVLTGASGAGKSSVLAAGLPAHLPDLAVLHFRPGPDPTARLARLLGVSRETMGRLDELPTALFPTPTLLLVDQAEELLTLASPEGAHEVAAALVVLAESGLARVVFSVRADHLAALCDLEPLRGRAGTAVELLSLPSRDQLAEALVRPLEPFGYRFESPSVVDRIVSALVGRPGGLPLMQFAADRLWDLRDEERGLLREADLESLGGIDGAITTYADKVLEALAPAEQAIAQQILVRCLQGGARHPLGVPALLSADWAGPRAREVLDHLVASRLLTRRADPEEGAVVEPAHEVLVAHWQRLARWVTQDALAHQVLSELIRAAHRWDQAGRRPDLLWSGSLLAQWLLFEREIGTHLGPNERRFVERSIALRRRRRRIQIGVALAVFLALLVLALLATLGWRQAAGAREDAVAARRSSEIDALLSRAAHHRERGETGEAISLARTVLHSEPASARAIAELYAAVGGRAEQTILTGHKDTVRDAAFSPDGAHLVTVAMDGFARVWGRDGKLIRTVEPGLGPAYRLRISPRGDRFTVVGAAGVARLYHLDGRQLATLDIGQQPALAAWDGSGERFILTGVDGKASFFDADGRPLRELSTESRGLGWAAFSPEGDRVVHVATGGSLGRVLALDGRTLVSFAPSAEAVYAEFSPVRGSGRILTASWPGTVQLFDRDGTGLARVAGRGRYPVAAWSPDGTRILAGAPGDEGALQILDGSGRLLHVLSGHRAPIHAATFGLGGVVASADEAGELRLHSATGERIAVLSGHAGRVWSLSFSADGTRLLSAAEDGTARLWDAGGRSRTRLMAGLPVEQCPIDPNGERVLTLTSDHVEGSTEVRLFTAGGDELAIWKDSGEAVVEQLRWRPDGEQAVALKHDGAMRWMARDGGDLGSLLPQSPVRVLAWRGTELLGGTEDGHVSTFTADGERGRERVFDGRVTSLVASSGRVAAAGAGGLALIEGAGRVTRVDPRPDVRALCWSPDGTRLAVGRDDASAEVRDEAGRLIANLIGHRERVVHCAWHPDSQRVATAGWDGDARIWSRDGALLEVVGGHRREVQTAMWSPDGSRFLTTEWAGVAILRDQRGILATFAGHGGEVVRASWAVAAPLIATCARNGRGVQLWPADDETLERWAAELVPEATPWDD